MRKITHHEGNNTNMFSFVFGVGDRKLVYRHPTPAARLVCASELALATFAPMGVMPCFGSSHRCASLPTSEMAQKASGRKMSGGKRKGGPKMKGGKCKGQRISATARHDAQSCGQKQKSGKHKRSPGSRKEEVRRREEKKKALLAELVDQKGRFRNLLEESRLREEVLIVRAQELTDEAMGLRNRIDTLEKSHRIAQTDMQSNLSAKQVEVKELVEVVETLHNRIKSLEQGRIKSLERTDSLEELVRQEQRLRLHWEGEAMDLRGRLDIMRGRPPPRGYLG